MKVFAIAGTNLRRLFRQPATIFFVIIFPWLLILLWGRRSAAPPRRGSVSSRGRSAPSARSLRTSMSSAIPARGTSSMPSNVVVSRQASSFPRATTPPSVTATTSSFVSSSGQVRSHNGLPWRRLWGSRVHSSGRPALPRARESRHWTMLLSGLPRQLQASPGSGFGLPGSASPRLPPTSESSTRAPAPSCSFSYS